MVDWVTYPTPEAYAQAVIDLISGVEGYDKLAYSIGKDLTIGYGFDLVTGGSVVLNAVFDAFNLKLNDSRLGVGSAAYNQENTYYNNLLKDIASDNASDFNATLVSRAGNAAITQVLGTLPSIMDKTMALNVLREILAEQYESRVNSAVPQSWERAALVSMGYLGIGSKGPAMTAALNGNLAQAWYDIRYKSLGTKPEFFDGYAQRAYYTSQIFGLYGKDGPSLSEALQAYQMLTQYRQEIFKYEREYGTDPDGSDPETPSNKIASAGGYRPLLTTALTLTQNFDPVLAAIKQQLLQLYGDALPAIGSGSTGGSDTSFQVRSTDVFVAYGTAAVSASTGDGTGADAIAEASRNHILIGTGAGQVLTGGGGDDIIVGGDGNETLNAGTGDDTLICGQGLSGTGTGGLSIDTLNAGDGYDVFVFAVPTSGTATETIKAEATKGVIDTDAGAIEVLKGGQVYTLGGSASSSLSAVAGQCYTWQDQDKDTYKFVPATGSPTDQAAAISGDHIVGTLTITGPDLGDGNQIVVNNFDLTQAEDPGNAQTSQPDDPNYDSGGCYGIYIPTTGTLSCPQPTSSGTKTQSAVRPDGIAAGIPTLVGGDLLVFTYTLDAASDTAEQLTFSLAGADASSFAIDEGDGKGLNPLGSSITIQPGQSSVTVALVSTGDITQASQLTLTASLKDANGNVADTSDLNFNYVPQTPDPFVDPITTSAVVGKLVDIEDGAYQYIGYNGDGGNDAITAGAGGPNGINLGGGDDVVNDEASGDVIGWYTEVSSQSTPGAPPILTTFAGDGGNNVINLNNNDDAVIAGSGDNRIYGNTEVDLATAIQQANAGGASGAQGSFLGAGDGDNTIVGGTGNDLIMVGQGNNVIVAGPGNETVIGGAELDSAQANWSTVLSGNDVTTVNVGWNTNASYGDFQGNYEGNTDVANGLPLGFGNDSIFLGSGNSWVALSNGNNYVDGGTGDSTVFGGMGDDTIFGGSGNVQVFGNGGDDYIEGGSGADTLSGGAGDNTIQGGAGNSVIFAGSDDDWASAETGNNLVEAGDGNDTIYGSGGADTLMAGSGNDSISAGDGSEYIDGGSGDDTIFAGKGNDTIYAGEGATTIIGSSDPGSSALIQGGDGSDLIFGGAGSDTLYSGDGGTNDKMTQVEASQTDASANTTIYGGAGDNQLFGGSGNTVIYGGAGTTAIVAEAGATTIYGGWGIETIIGGSGNDLIYAGDGGDDVNPNEVMAGSGQSTLYGGGGDSFLEDTSNGGDLIVSQDGDDTLLGTGSDTLVAGTGDDVLAGIGSGVTYQFNQGFGDDTIASVIGEASGAANIVFGDGMVASDFTADIEEDSNGALALVISGDGGSIAIENGFMPGGVAGTITFLDPETPTFDQFIQQSGEDDDISEANGDLVFNVDDSQSLTASNTEVDTISAWGNNDTLTSSGTSMLVVGGDNSIVYGNGYNDLIGASGNNDTLVASGYSDIIVVTNASTVVEAQSGIGDTLAASVSYVLPENLQILLLQGSDGLVATGNDLDDTIIANTGNDTLIAGSGLATLIGGSGNDTFVVNNIGDVIQDTTAGAQNVIESSVSYATQTNIDTLIFTGDASVVGTGNGDATNLIVANSGSDTLIAGSGLDTFVGGSGSDTYVFNSGFGDTLIELGSGQQTIDLASGVTKSDISITTALVGGMQVLQIDTGSGVISLAGYDYNNVQLAFSDGSSIGLTQLIEQDHVTATVAGANGNLILDGDNSDSVKGGAGDDTIIAFGGNDTLTAGSGDQLIEAIGDNSLVTAGVGSDTLIGLGQAETLVGSGNTLFIVNNTGDVVQESSSTANDTVESSVDFVLPTHVNTLILTGSADLSGTANDGNDLIQGNGGNDTLTAGSGNDTLVAGSGLATLVGGSGSAVFVINNSDDVVQVGTGASTIESSASINMGVGIDTLVLIGSDDLSATGNGDSDVITANSGNDTLIAGTGAATLIGGSGNDTFVVNSGADVIRDNSSSSSNVVESSVDFTLRANLDTLILTQSANLKGTGNDDATNLIVGNAGNDTLVAGTGADTLMAGSGLATMIGSGGGDTFIVDNSADVVQESSAGSGDVVESSANYSVQANVDTLILIGTSDLIGTGNGDATNLIEGNAGADTLTAGSGADTLVAGTGLATLIGGSGSDSFVVNDANDVVVAGSGNSTIYSSDDFVLPTDVNVLVLTGSDDLSATANSGNDLIVANSGDDVLTDGGGIDTLVGGSGDDTFVVNSLADVVVGQADSDGGVIESSVNYTLAANVGVLELIGSDSLVANAGGNDGVLIANDGADTLIAGSGNVSMFGGSGNDTFVAGSGNDFIQAGYGVNTYDLSQGFGQVEISGIQSTDTVKLGSGITAANLSLTATTGSDGDLDFTIDEGTSSIVIDGGFTPVPTVNIDFADGSSTTLSQLLAADGNVLTIAGADGNIEIAAADNTSVLGGTGTDTLVASDNNDTLAAGSGSELMIGGTGNTVFVAGSGNDFIEAGDTTGGGNTYVVNQGFGNVSISGGTTADTLAFGTGISLADLSVTAAFDANGSVNLVITDGAGTGSITLDGGVSPTQLGNITFADGSSIGLLQLIEQQGVSTTLTDSDGNETDFVVGNGLALTGGSQFQNIYAIGDNDTLTSVSDGSNLTVYGNNDQLIGSTDSASSDMLVADGINDTLMGGTGEELLVGGAGQDLFIVNSVDTSIENATATDTVESSTSYAMDPGVDSLIVVGSANVTITGNDDVSNVIAGNASNYGTDVIYANAENTTVEGGYYQTIYGGDGASLIDYAGGGASTIFAGSGDLVVEDNSSDGENTVYVGSGDSSLSLIGGSGDTIVVGSGNDTLQGADDTTYEFGAGFGNDLVVNATSDSAVVFSGILPNALTLSAALGQGNDADLVISDGAGSITIEGGLSGSIGSIDYDDEQQFIEQFGPGYQSIAGADGNFIFDSSDNASVVGGSGNDTISAWGDNDTLVAGSSGTLIDARGDDALVNGGAGADTLSAYGNNDTLIAGSEPDTFVVNSSTAVIEAQPGGQDSVFASVNYMLADNLQFLELVAAGIVGVGNGQNDTLLAGGDDDALQAGSGTDVLVGQGNGDTLVGGNGIDTLIAGNGGSLVGSDQATYVLTAGIGQVEVVAAQDSGGIVDLEGLSAAEVSVSAAIGNDGAASMRIVDTSGDVFTLENAFSGGIGSLSFGSGQDQSLAQFMEEVAVAPTTLAGANGNLILSGTAGDSITGGNGNDTIVGLGNDDTIIAGSGDSRIFGMGADEVLVGGIGDDSLYGGTGDDTLIAGYGFNTLFGGGGNDAYELTAGGFTTIVPGDTAGSESLYLPPGASLSDYTAYADGNNLVILSTDGQTITTIDNYFSTTAKNWFLFSAGQAPVTLQSWLNSLPGWGSDSYGSLISALEKIAEPELAWELSRLGQPGGTLDSAIDPRFTALDPYFYYPDQYTFEGVSTQDVSVQGGSLVLDSSESDNDQLLTQSSQVVVEVPGSPSTPIYQLGNGSGQQYTVYLSQLPQGTSSVELPPGATDTPILDGNGNLIGWTVVVPGGPTEVQTGTTTATPPTFITETVTTDLADISSRSFTEYNVVGDDGNDNITMGSGDYSPVFVGTVTTGDGNSYINLGGTANGSVDGVEGVPGTDSPFKNGSGPGAFIVVGNGNNTIIGSSGDDTIAVGTGFNSIDGGTGGDTYYVPLTGNSTDIIDDSGIPDPYALLLGASVSEEGNSAYLTQGPGTTPMDTLVLPTGVTPQDLKYRVFNPDPSNPSQHALELVYGSSTVLIMFSDIPAPVAPQPGWGDGVEFVVDENGTITCDSFAQYSVGELTTTARQGVDMFQFADGTLLSLDQLLAQATQLSNDFDPNVAVPNPTPTLLAGQTVAASSLFSASDTPDNPISWYQISNSGGGYFILGGQVQAAGSTFDVSAVQLSSLQYVAGSDGSDDQISIGAFDGATWAYGSVDVTVQGQTYFAATGANQLVDCSSVAYADTLVGGYAHDTLVGGSGTNTFVVGSSTVVIQDGPNGGVDSVLSSVSYTLAANVDVLELTANNNTGTANTDNDTLIATGTGDTLVGGGTTASNDLFIVSSATDVVTLATTYGSDTVESSVSYSLTSAARVVDLVLTGTADLMATGNALSNVLVANSGNDTLVASGTSSDTLVGGTGNDLFVVNAASDVVSVGSVYGVDTVESSVSYSLVGGVDTLILTANNKTGTANTDNDTLIATGTGDTLVGGGTTASNDLFIVSSATDVVTLATTYGSDTVESSVSYSLTSAARVVDLVLTGTADLMATGNALSNVLVANSGNDTLVASGTSSDTLVGGTGNDLFVVNAASDVVSVGSVYGIDTISSSVSYTLAANVDTLLLTANNNKGTANTDNDTLIALGTGDTLVGGTTTASNDLFVIDSSTDVVSIATTTHGVDTIESSVSYSLASTANATDLVLTGTADLMATGNALSNVLVANSGNDTLVASGTSSDTLVGGTGNDLFVVNAASDVVSVGSVYGVDTVESSVSYSLVGGVDTLILTANNKTGTANTDNDTLIATGTGDTLVGGGTTASNDLFIVSSATDVVTLATTYGSDTVESSVSYSLTSAARVVDLVLTGTADLMATGNALSNVLVANSGNDTLVASGTSSDTLVGGTGNDLFVVNAASDVVSVGSVYGIDTISSSVNYSLVNTPDVNVLQLTAANRTGTANSGFDLLQAQSTGDTLKGGSGVDVLEGGTGNNVLSDTVSGSIAALIGGSGGNTLTGGAGNDFYAAGSGGATITTGASQNVIAVNLGSGAVTLNPKSGASDVLTLGGGIDTESLSFSKSGNNLILSDGQGDAITLSNWYASNANQNIATLQVIEQASSSYDASSSDPLHNQAIQEFSFASLVSQFNAALAANPSLTSWSLATGMPTAALSSSATAAYGGDLAYYYGLNGSLSGLNLSDADSVLQSTSFGSGVQTLNTGATGGPVTLAKMATMEVAATSASTLAANAQPGATGSGNGTSQGTGSSDPADSALSTTPSLTLTDGGITLPSSPPPIFGQQTGTGDPNGSGGGVLGGGESSTPSSPGNDGNGDPSFSNWLQNLLNQSSAPSGGGATPFTGTLYSGGGGETAPSLSDILGSTDGNGFVTSDALRSATGDNTSKSIDAGLFADADSLKGKSNASQWSLANDASADSQRSSRMAKIGDGAEDGLSEDMAMLDFLPSSIHHRMMQHKGHASAESARQS